LCVFFFVAEFFLLRSRRKDFKWGDFFCFSRSLYFPGSPRRILFERVERAHGVFSPSFFFFLVDNFTSREKNSHSNSFLYFFFAEPNNEFFFFLAEAMAYSKLTIAVVMSTLLALAQAGKKKTIFFFGVLFLF